MPGVKPGLLFTAFSMKDLPMKLKLLIPGIVLVFLAACSPPPELRDSKMWQDRSLVTGEPCAAPCWQGITPGETTWNEAQTLISTMSGVIDLQTQEQEGQIGAVWRTNESEQYCCAIVSNVEEAVDDTDVVDYIQVRLSPDVTLGELIEVHGDPTYVVNGEEVTEDQAYVVLLYPDIPIIAYAFVAGAANGTLSASSEIIFVVYVTPEAMETEVIRNSNLQAWDGYQSFSYYAESESNPYELTAQPTPVDGAEQTSEATIEATAEDTSDSEATAEATTEATAEETPGS